MTEWKDEITKRLSGLKLEPAREAEITEELAQHMEDRYQELLASGVAEQEAHQSALQEFADTDLLAQELRGVEHSVTCEPVVLGAGSSKNILADLWQDVRYGLRQLRRNPGFTAVAVITLALGIGASTTIFSVVYPVLMDPYPYKGADRMVNFAITGRTQGDQRDWYALDEFRAIRDQNRVFDGLVAYSAFNKVLSGGKLPEIVFVTEMTGNAFQYFGIPPLVGREWTSADAPQGKAPARVAVLSFRFWKRHYGSARNVMGKTIRLDGQPYTIIGVLPRRFTWHNADVYLPSDRSWKYAWIGARLRPGVTLGQARADVALIFHRLSNLHPHDYPVNGFTIQIEGLDDWSLGSFRERLLLLVAAVGLLLLIACANVANLQLARGSARETEFVIRTSVGASRGRIIRQLLTENVTLALLGGFWESCWLTPACTLWF